MEKSLGEQLSEVSLRLRERAAATGDSDISELMRAIALALETLQVLAKDIDAVKSPALEISPED